MSKDVKNVIVLRNIYSNTFEEVIFVLKKGARTSSIQRGDLVAEAKKVVENYVNQREEYRPHEMHGQISQNVNGLERGESLNKVLNISLIISIILFASMLIRVF